MGHFRDRRDPEQTSPQNIRATPETSRRLAASATLVPTWWSFSRTGGKNKPTEHKKTRPFVNQPKQGFNLMLWRELLYFADGLKMGMWWVPWDQRAVAFQHTPGTPSGTSSPGHERPQPLQRSLGPGTWSETWAALGGAVRMKNAREGELAACGDWCVLFTMYRSSLPEESGWSHFVSLAETDAAWTHSHSDSFTHTQQTVSLRNYCQKYCRSLTRGLMVSTAALLCCRCSFINCDMTMMNSVSILVDWWFKCGHFHPCGLSRNKLP